MSRQPYMQLWIADFLGDTLHLSDAEIGQYMLLLMAMWRNGGSLPADPGKLARIARNPVSENVMAYFAIANGSLTQNRLRSEWERARAKSEARSEAGRRGNEAKALKRQGTALAIANAKGHANGSHLPEPEPERKKEDGAKAPPAFQGKIIRLNQADYDLWISSFRFVDLRPYLVSRDEFLAGLADDDDRRKRWMISTSADLRNKNAAEKAKRKPAGGGLKFKDSGPEPVKPPIEDRERQVAVALGRGAIAQREAAE